MTDDFRAFRINIDRALKAFEQTDADAGSRFLVDGAQLSVIRPGDTLVVRVSRITQDQVAAAKASIEALLPGVTVVVLGVEQLAIFRPSAAGPSPDGRVEAVADVRIDPDAASRFAPDRTIAEFKTAIRERWEAIARAADAGCPLPGCTCQLCESSRLQARASMDAQSRASMDAQSRAWMPTRSGPVGLTANQYKTLPSADQALVDAWMVENGAERSGCMAIRFDPDGSAHFLQSVTLDLARPVETWLCVPSPTERPDVAWHPWGMAS